MGFLSTQMLSISVDSESVGQMEESSMRCRINKIASRSEFAMWASFQPLYDLMLEKTIVF